MGSNREHFGTEIVAGIEPSIDWVERMKPQMADAKAAGISMQIDCPDADRELVIRLSAMHVTEIRTLQRPDWPMARIDLGVLAVFDGEKLVPARIKLTELRERGLKKLREKNPGLARIVEQQSDILER